MFLSSDRDSFHLSQIKMASMLNVPVRKKRTTCFTVSKRSMPTKANLIVRDIKAVYFPITPLYIIREDPSKIACKFPGIYNIPRADLTMDETNLRVASRHPMSEDMVAFVGRNHTLRNKCLFWHCIFCKMGFTQKGAAMRHANGGKADATSSRQPCDMREGKELDDNQLPVIKCEGASKCPICIEEERKFVEMVERARNQRRIILAEAAMEEDDEENCTDETGSEADDRQGSPSNAASSTSSSHAPPVVSEGHQDEAGLGASGSCTEKVIDDRSGFTPETAVCEETLQSSEVHAVIHRKAETSITPAFTKGDDEVMIDRNMGAAAPVGDISLISKEQNGRQLEEATRNPVMSRTMQDEDESLPALQNEASPLLEAQVHDDFNIDLPCIFSPTMLAHV
jgi:hypothetical protein